MGKQNKTKQNTPKFSGVHNIPEQKICLGRQGGRSDRGMQGGEGKEDENFWRRNKCLSA